MKKIILSLICLFVSFQSVKAGSSESLLTPSAPGGAFLTGETLTFNNTTRSAYTYEVLRQPKDQQVGCGDLGGEDTLKLEPLPNGYYTLRAKATPVDPPIDIPFAVLANPADSPATVDSFFALDVPLSVLVHHRQAEKAVEIARRSGVKLIRERNPIWHRVEPKRDEIDYGIFARNLTLFSDAGIRVLSMYHTSPAWSRPLRPDLKMPDDLFALYTYSKRIALSFGDRCPAFEFWNEMDFGGGDSAWDYASCLKAASLGYKAGRPETKVLNGGFAIEAGDLPYHHVLMMNDIGAYLDVLSLHSYGSIVSYQGFMRKASGFLEKYHYGHLPVWYTETGCRAEGKGEIVHDGKIKEHSLTQELVVAEFLVKQMITAQFCGAERDFFFSLYPCNEEGGTKVWGLTRRDTLDIKAGYVAFSVLNQELGAAQLLGRATGLPSGTTGFLYQHPDQTHTLVVWRESEIDQRRHEEGLSFNNDQIVSVSFPIIGIASAINIFGTPVELKNGDKQVAFDLGRMPVYLRNVAPLQIELSAIQSDKTEKNTTKLDKTIVFQAVFSSDIKIAAEDGPWKSKPRQRAQFIAAQGQLSLFVYNFDAEAKTGLFTATGATAFGVPEQEFQLEPMSKKEFQLKVFPEEAAGEIVIRGWFNCQETSRLVIPFEVAGIQRAEREQIPLDQAGSWRVLSSGKAAMKKLEDDNGFEFQTEFSRQDNDPWSYPEYSLLPTEALQDGDKIVFELALDSSSKDLRFMQMLAHFHGGGRQDFEIPLPEQTGQYTPVCISLKGFHRADKVRAIALGGNLKSGTVFSYRIRNLMIIKK